MFNLTFAGSAILPKSQNAFPPPGSRWGILRLDSYHADIVLQSV